MIFSWLLGSIGLALIAAAPLILVGAIAIAWRHRTRSWADATLPVVRVLAIPTVVLVILVFALRPGDIVPGDTYAINLDPFRDLRRSVEFGQSTTIDIQNLVGNAAMFVPLGLAIAWVFPGVRFLTVLLVAVALSVTIEVAQSTPQRRALIGHHRRDHEHGRSRDRLRRRPRLALVDAGPGRGNLPPRRVDERDHGCRQRG